MSGPLNQRKQMAEQPDSVAQILLAADRRQHFLAGGRVDFEARMLRRSAQSSVDGSNGYDTTGTAGIGAIMAWEEEIDHCHW